MVSGVASGLTPQGVCQVNATLDRSVVSRRQQLQGEHTVYPLHASELLSIRQSELAFVETSGVSHLRKQVACAGLPVITSFNGLALTASELGRLANAGCVKGTLEYDIHARQILRERFRFVGVNLGCVDACNQNRSSATPVVISGLLTAAVSESPGKLVQPLSKVVWDLPPFKCGGKALAVLRSYDDAMAEALSAARGVAACVSKPADVFLHTPSPENLHELLASADAACAEVNRRVVGVSMNARAFSGGAVDVLLRHE